MTNYWNNRYRRHRGSGLGSIGKFAEFKANFVNDLIREHDIKSVYDLGCGDGEIASRIVVESYVGYDPATHAILQCKAKMPDRRFISKNLRGSAEMTLSLDVIYHLIRDEDYERHLSQLFTKATKLVCIYSNDKDESLRDSHVRHRKFTPYVTEHFSKWKLISNVSNPHPEETWSEFFIYGPKQLGK